MKKSCSLTLSDARPPVRSCNRLLSKYCSTFVMSQCLAHAFLRVLFSRFLFLEVGTVSVVAVVIATMRSRLSSKSLQKESWPILELSLHICWVSSLSLEVDGPWGQVGLSCDVQCAACLI